jgi:hypothetical protein
MTTRNCVPAFVLAALIVATVPGCGSGKASVSGTVKYRGKLLAMGTVFLAGPDHLQVLGQINPDGTYRIDGVAAGSVQIGVASLKPSATRPRPTKTRTRGAAPPPPVDDSGWFEIPDKYTDPLTSGLTVDLKSGTNEYDIELP